MCESQQNAEEDVETNYGRTETETIRLTRAIEARKTDKSHEVKQESLFCLQNQKLRLTRNLACKIRFFLFRFCLF